MLTKMESVQIKTGELDEVIVNNKQYQCDYIDENMQNLKNSMTVDANYANINHSKEDMVQNFYNSVCICKTKYEETHKEHNMHYPNEIHKIHRLTPINEQNEDSLTDFCYHGCKNGCSATVPTPQEVSEKVFKENWLQKLEDIKQKETVLRNKEITLQNREKALFKKEREIKILECLWKHKLKQLDLYFKENKHSQCSLKEYSMEKDTLESMNSVDSSEVHKEEFYDDCTEKLDNNCVKQNVCMQTIPAQHVSCNQTEQLEKQVDNIGIVYQEKTNTSSSSCSLSNMPVAKKVKRRPSLRNSVIARSSYSKSTYNSNNRTKRPSKIDYSDLDTTLSADVGDSSFVQTSQKFNPEVYRKPYMFTRSASERHIKHVNNKSNPSLEGHNLNNSDERPGTLVGIEQDKVLERVTKNIVASRDKSTKFQHYGYMDKNIKFANKMCGIENEKRYSYLDLETGSKLCSCQKLNKDFKDRPVSWNEETNEWLQKKRKAYNMMMKKVHTENKENLECDTKVNSKSEKVVKKKDIKNRILTIFR